MEGIHNTLEYKKYEYTSRPKFVLKYLGLVSFSVKTAVLNGYEIQTQTIHFIEEQSSCSCLCTSVCKSQPLFTNQNKDQNRLSKHFLSSDFLSLLMLLA